MWNAFEVLRQAEKNKGSSPFPSPVLFNKPGRPSYRYEAFKKSRATCRINTKPSKNSGQRVVSIRSSQKKPGNASYQYEAFKKSRATCRINTTFQKKPFRGYSFAAGKYRSLSSLSIRAEFHSVKERLE
ncbi:MAG TPA: hypothetical protein DEG28_10065 [Porphyromonadaceae bacterium]|nr:hypothetical protein [Porphyromonadaceae bacterium]HBX46212.1 hypothetical protein [Porphyromonadaceae bacterium]